MKVEAYFRGIKSANDAAAKLKSKGFNNAVVDINDHYEDFNSGVKPILPGNENAPNLSRMVLNSGPYIEDPSKNPLNAASPMVSGMGGFEEITDVNYKLTMEVDENSEEQVEKMLKEMGGTLKSPNLDLPHRLEDIHLNTRDLDLNTMDT